MRRVSRVVADNVASFRGDKLQNIVSAAVARGTTISAKEKSNHCCSWERSKSSDRHFVTGAAGIISYPLDYASRNTEREIKPSYRMVRRPQLRKVNGLRLSSSNAYSGETDTHAAESNKEGNPHMSTMPAVSNKIVDEFVEHVLQLLPDLIVTRNKYELDRHGKGEDANPRVPPQVVMYPTSTQEVSTICKLNSSNPKYRIPIIPFGTGTSLEGHVAALRGGISLDTSKLLYNINAEDVDLDHLVKDFQITVGAGVTREALNNQALRHTGLEFVVDPGANASLGGMVACGASGTRAVKYGTMKDNILGLECVLANGDIVQTGTKAIKSSAGYDLTRLMCGSEGTLGIITRITVKLHPIHAIVHAVVCRFDTLPEAAEAVASIKQCGVDVQRLELLDTITVEAFNKYNKSHNSEASPLPLQPHLFMEFAGVSATSVNEQVMLAKTICVGEEEEDGNNGTGGQNTEPQRFRVETDPDARMKLWAARHQLHYASIHLREGADSSVVTDACVPLSEFASIFLATAEDLKELNIQATLFGHAGDGNFHCDIPICSTEDYSSSSDYMDRIKELNHRLIQRTLAVGGTCTGEHGIGWGKKKYLKEQYSPETLNMMKAIKHALDPFHIMNPGKIIDMD